MSRFQRVVLSFIFIMFSTVTLTQATVDTLKVRHEGLSEPVEIIKDVWGISHIYAENERDLFFAQGYNAARDRLFQFEIWRRQATGTTAEILGPRAVERDIGTRLFKFRGDMTAEMNHYHPNGEKIITSYVRGVNAYIERARENTDLLSIGFELLGIKPQKWTPEVVISRHQGLLGNIRSELNYGRAVDLLGPEKVRELTNFGPGEPELALDESIDGSLLHDDILGLYKAFRQPIDFRPEDLVAAYRGDEESYQQLKGATNQFRSRMRAREQENIGSNNWVVSGAKTESGFPIMANDPHRTQEVPSLRYWVHLNAPGWNVIGGGEPTIPGVSIGHNEHGAWGLTVFDRDGEDLYVYDTNPDNPSQYKYQGRWEDMRVIEEQIQVKGQDPVQAELKYTRHGPVVYEDEENNVAYAVRAAWMEIGGAPYLASLRMDQAQNWEEFREACSYSHIPGENMVWADKDGNIGWQPVGISPIRPNWSGLVPVPGDGSHEWDGYLPIKRLPHVYNPEKGFWGTANEQLIPRGYEFEGALAFEWSDPYRASRVDEVLDSGRKHSMMEMMQLQTDYLSIPARQLVPLLRDLEAEDTKVDRARRMLLDWNYKLNKNSVEAGIYVAWERRLEANMTTLFVPEEGQDILRGISMDKMIDWLIAPRSEFGDDPVRGRNEFLIRSLEEAVSELNGRLGTDMSNWQLGQEDYKHALIRHPLSPAVDDETRQKLNVGPLPRGGNGYTVGNTGGGNNQTSGASFRIIADTEDWDNTVGMNNPGQTEDPGSPYYDNLFEMWANDKFFPVFFSRSKVESVANDVIHIESED